jgi:hypothetical protein
VFNLNAIYFRVSFIVFVFVNLFNFFALSLLFANSRGAAGFAAAFALREFGFEGKIIQIGLEKHLPYDRTKLSKNLSIDVTKILLAKETDYEAARIEFRIGEVCKAFGVRRMVGLVFFFFPE